MIKMIQVLKHLKSQGLDLDQVMTELHEIMDNGNSQYFELTDDEIQRISKVYHNERLFDSALNIVYLDKVS